MGDFSEELTGITKTPILTQLILPGRSGLNWDEAIDLISQEMIAEIDRHATYRYLHRHLKNGGFQWGNY